MKIIARNLVNNYDARIMGGSFLSAVSGQRAYGEGFKLSAFKNQERVRLTAFILRSENNM